MSSLSSLGSAIRRSCSDFAMARMARHTIIPLAVLVGFGLSGTSFAQTAPPVVETQCILGQPDAPPNLNCTSNDVTLSTPVATVIKGCDFPGDTATLEVIVDVQGGAKTRYDVGIWVSVDGDPNNDGSESGICTVLSLPNDIFATNGASVNIDGDACGDVPNTGNEFDIEQADLGRFDVFCEDSDGDGNLNIPLIIAWDNNQGGVCEVSTDAIPNTAAKCRKPEPVNVPVPIPGRLIVNKTTVPVSDTSFTFTLTGPDSGITGGFDGSFQFPLATGESFDSGVAFAGGVPAGSYSLVETANANYDSTGSCTSDLDGTTTNSDPASLTVRPGETITCDFTNTLNIGTLIVRKSSVGGTDVFNFGVYDSSGGLVESPQLDTSAANPAQSAYVLTVDTYSITEIVPAGWLLSGVSCVNGQGSNVGSADVSTATISQVILAPGDTVTCTFVDNALGTVSLTKTTDGGDGTFTFSTTIPDVDPFDVDTTDGTGVSGALTNVAAGTYQVSETVPAGWRFVSATCEDQDGNTVDTATPVANGVEFTHATGQTTSCVFANEKLGTVIIQKATAPAGTDSFTFQSGLWAGDQAVAAGTPLQIDDVVPGSYSVTEVDPTPAFDLTDIVCVDGADGGTNSTWDLGTRTATLNVDPGETVSCTFTNTQRGSITVTKTLDGDPTGLSTSFAFTTSYGNPFNLDPVNGPASNQSADLDPATTYSVTETIPTTAGWVLLSANCEGRGTVNLGTGTISDITLDPGQDLTCTFTNTVPTLTLEKTGTLNLGGDGVANPGDTIEYEFTVTNTGKVTLNNIVVSDANANVVITGSPIESLSPGASDTSVTGSYVLTQADIDAGTFTNTATATSDEGASDDDDDTRTLGRLPAIVLQKTGTLDDGDDGVVNVGDTINYTFSVQNTGNVTLTNVTVTDPKITVLGGPIASLAPGVTDSGTFTGSYALTQVDIDAGTFTNTATASGTPPAGAPVTDDDSDTQTLPRSPSLALVKTATPDVFGAPGVQISYGFTVTNTGNVTLSNVTVSDPLQGLGAVDCGGGSPSITSMAPGASVVCAASLTTTQDQLDSGRIDNTATATGTPPGGGNNVSATDDATVFSNLVPNVEIIKSASPTTFAQAGVVITYTLAVRNTGNETLTNVTVTDPLSGLSAVDCGGGSPTIASLAPTDPVVNCTATLTTTQSQVDSGSISNTASVVGTHSGGTVTDSDSTTVNSTAGAGIAIAKTANPTTFDKAGETITYTLAVTNDGGVTLSNVLVSDPLAGLSAITCGAEANPIVDLAPGETVNCTASLTTTQGQVDAGSIDNTATATATPPNNADPVSASDSVTVDSTAGASVAIVKSANPTKFTKAGDLITYTLVVTNDGGVTLSNVLVSDPLPGLSAVTCGAEANPIVDLAPGETVNCTATLTTTQDQVNAGNIDNTATATGSSPGQQDDVSATGTARVLNEAPESYVITKTVTDVAGKGPTGEVNVAGDTISYEITVQNTGQTTLNNVVVEDPMITLSCNPTAPAMLDPNVTMTCTGTYVVVQSDIDDEGKPTPGSGVIENTATVSSDELADQTDSASVSVVPPEIIIDALAEVCINDVPYIQYDVRTIGLAPNLPVTIRFFGDGGNGSTDPADYTTQVGEFSGLADSGQLLWPGATVDAQGNGLTWPGWQQLPDGTWVEIDDGLVPTLLMEFEVNPTTQQIIDYPPRTANCVPPQGGPLPPALDVPVNNPWALLLMLLSMLGLGWYYRPVRG